MGNGTDIISDVCKELEDLGYAIIAIIPGDSFWSTGPVIRPWDLDTYIADCRQRYGRLTPMVETPEEEIPALKRDRTDNPIYEGAQMAIRRRGEFPRGGHSVQSGER